MQLKKIFTALAVSALCCGVFAQAADAKGKIFAKFEGPEEDFKKYLYVYELPGCGVIADVDVTENITRVIATGQLFEEALYIKHGEKITGHGHVEQQDFTEAILHVAGSSNGHYTLQGKLGNQAAEDFFEGLLPAIYYYVKPNTQTASEAAMRTMLELYDNLIEHNALLGKHDDLVYEYKLLIDIGEYVPAQGYGRLVKVYRGEPGTRQTRVGYFLIDATLDNIWQYGKENTFKKIYSTDYRGGAS